MMDKWQTPYTPNVLGIYLLMRSLKKRKIIEQTHQKIKSRSEAWQKFFRGSKNIKLYIKNQGVRSRTVIACRKIRTHYEIKKTSSESERSVIG